MLVQRIAELRGRDDEGAAPAARSGVRTAARRDPLRRGIRPPRSAMTGVRPDHVHRVDGFVAAHRLCGPSWGTC